MRCWGDKKGSANTLVLIPKFWGDKWGLVLCAYPEVACYLPQGCVPPYYAIQLLFILSLCTNSDCVTLAGKYGTVTLRKTRRKTRLFRRITRSFSTLPIFAFTLHRLVREKFHFKRKNPTFRCAGVRWFHRERAMIWKFGPLPGLIRLVPPARALRKNKNCHGVFPNVRC